MPMTGIITGFTYDTNLLQGGYREGIAFGKESKLQEGFNEGFSAAGKASYQLAVERGKLR